MFPGLSAMKTHFISAGFLRKTWGFLQKTIRRLSRAGNPDLKNNLYLNPYNFNPPFIMRKARDVCIF